MYYNLLLGSVGRKAALLWPWHIDRSSCLQAMQGWPLLSTTWARWAPGSLLACRQWGGSQGRELGGGCSLQLGAGQEPSWRRMERNGLSKDCKHWVEFLQLRKPVEAAGPIDTVSGKEGELLLKVCQPAVLILPCMCVTLFTVLVF